MKFISHISSTVSLSFLIMLSLLMVQPKSFAQEGNRIYPKKNGPPVHEVAEGEYTQIDRNAMPTSTAYKYSIPGFFMVQVNVSENGENIVGDASNEPSIAVDPTDANKMAIGWRHFATISNNFRQAGIGYTSDGGQTWTFPEVIDPGIFRSDPVLDADASGTFYYNSLTVTGEDYSCDVYKSSDGGATWDNGTFAFGGDKQWMTIDKSGGIGDGHLYAYWTSSYSICDPDFFTRSTDYSVSWENCISIDGFPYWGTNTVDAEGNLYIGGRQWNNFIVVKSSNAQDPAASINWDFVAQVDLDGSLVGFGGYNCPNPAGLLGQTFIDVDRSDGPNHGNVYLLASVERDSNNDPCDVMFSKSTNGGSSWTSPIRINDDLGNFSYQWFGTMAVAPNGRIDVIWLDTRDNPGTVLSSLYYTNSEDGGETWLENVKLTESFDPHLGWPQQDKMGDYFQLVSDETGANLAWAATFNGEQDVYYARISMSTTGIKQNDKTKKLTLGQNYPNPFREQTNIQYLVNVPGHVKIHISDMNGKEVATLVNEMKSKGQHQVLFDGSGLTPGVYYYTLTTAGRSETKKMLVID